MTTLLRREARALLRQGRLIAMRSRACDVPVSGPRVVLFIHGFIAGGAVFEPLRARIQDGLGLPCTAVNYGPLLSFEGMVDRLEGHVQRFVDSDSSVSLVAHSLGGVVARWYAQERCGAARLDRLITVATPHQGTKRARFKPGSVAAALRPGSRVLRRLAAGHDRLANVSKMAIVAGDDHMCRPLSSAAAFEGAEVVWIDGVGHNEALFDRRVHDVVLRALR